MVYGTVAGYGRQARVAGPRDTSLTFPRFDAEASLPSGFGWYRCRPELYDIER